MIIETSCNKMYSVRDAGERLSNVYVGFRVKKVAGKFVPVANAKDQLVRRAATTVVSNEVVTI